MAEPTGSVNCVTRARGKLAATLRASVELIDVEYELLRRDGTTQYPRWFALSMTRI